MTEADWEIALEVFRGCLPRRGDKGRDDRRRSQSHGSPRADVRQHHRSRPRVGRRCKRGQRSQALGRSRGGFTTKIHLKTDFDGQPLAFHLTGGEASDSPQFPRLLGLGPDITPRAAMTDKGYDARSVRTAARDRGIVPIIPVKKNMRQSPKCFPKILYKGRSRIEHSVGKLKRF